MLRVQGSSASVGFDINAWKDVENRIKEVLYQATLGASPPRKNISTNSSLARVKRVLQAHNHQPTTSEMLEITVYIPECRGRETDEKTMLTVQEKIAHVRYVRDLPKRMGLENKVKIKVRGLLAIRDKESFEKWIDENKEYMEEMRIPDWLKDNSDRLINDDSINSWLLNNPELVDRFGLEMGHVAMFGPGSPIVFLPFYHLEPPYQSAILRAEKALEKPLFAEALKKSVDKAETWWNKKYGHLTKTTKEDTNTHAKETFFVFTSFFADTCENNLRPQLNILLYPSEMNPLDAALFAHPELIGCAPGSLYHVKVHPIAELEIRLSENAIRAVMDHLADARQFTMVPVPAPHLQFISAPSQKLDSKQEKLTLPQSIEQSIDSLHLGAHY